MAERNRQQRILIFQIGSLGDTVISMPCYREIARRHPGSVRFLLTNFPQTKMVPAEAILKSCGLIDATVEYPMPLRGAANIFQLLKKLRALQIDHLYYLTPEKRLGNLLRHASFFRACGISTLHGLPWTRDLRYPRELTPGTMWESEASRLLRCTVKDRAPGPPPAADRSLDLTPAEQGTAAALLRTVPGMERFVAVSVGGKLPIKDWGDRNWAEVLAQVSAANPQLGAVFVGSADEFMRNQELARSWAGPALNACGLLGPRESAAIIAQSELFLGHDTGTLHLAAAVETRVIGVYSARNEPGKWFSDRPADTFFYHQPPCFGCELDLPEQCPNGIVCMTAHQPGSVSAAVNEVLAHG